RNVFIREENIQIAFNHFDTAGRGAIRPQELVAIFGSLSTTEAVAKSILMETDPSNTTSSRR
ncbi:unnamed protein product, partial [Heterosigma akashiwo]